MCMFLSCVNQETSQQCEKHRDVHMDVRSNQSHNMLDKVTEPSIYHLQ
jgi:hypothetical protein